MHTADHRSSQHRRSHFRRPRTRNIYWQPSKCRSRHRSPSHRTYRAFGAVCSCGGWRSRER